VAAYRAQPTIAEAEDVLQRLAFAGFRRQREATDLGRVLAERMPDVIVREETGFGAAFAAERAGLLHASVGFDVPAWDDTRAWGPDFARDVALALSRSSAWPGTLPRMRT
jgi:hypothetical protein